MNMILSNLSTLKKSSEIAETNDIPLKCRNFSNDLEKIQNNIENSKKNKGRGIPEAKSNFRILVAGGAPGIGISVKKNSLWEKEKILIIRQSISFQYIFLDFSNSVQLDGSDSKLSIEILVGLRIAYAFFTQSNYSVTFPTFCQTVLTLNKEKYFYTDNVVLGIREHLDLTGNQLLFLFLHIDEFQTIFDFKGWKTDMMKDINGNPKGIFRGILYNVGRFMIGNSNLSFIQPFLSGTAPQSVIRQKEPTMYTFEFVNCSLLNMQSRIDIVNHFANSKGFPSDVWSMQEQMYFLLCDTGGLPRAIECLLKCCFGKRYERTEKFFQDINLLDYNAIHSNVARDIDNMYAITTWAIDHNELAEAIIYRCLAAMPSMKSDLLSVKYSDTLESLECDQHLILTDYAENDNRVLITLPPIFIHLYIQALKSFVVVGKLSVSLP
nr:2292_t:CDS:2 [Entrophospora candida]